VGTQVTCVWGGYENGTYMYGGVPVCLSVLVVPTPRLVRILCAPSAVSLSLCAVKNIHLLYVGNSISYKSKLRTTFMI